jgi:hypothetical protein
VNGAEVQLQLHLVKDIIAKNFSPAHSLFQPFSLGALHLTPSNAEILFALVKVSSRTPWMAHEISKPCTGQREEVFEYHNVYFNTCTLHLLFCTMTNKRTNN